MDVKFETLVTSQQTNSNILLVTDNTFELRLGLPYIFGKAYGYNKQPFFSSQAALNLLFLLGTYFEFLISFIITVVYMKTLAPDPYLRCPFSGQWRDELPVCLFFVPFIWL